MNSLARALRKNSIEAERCLWSRLRGRRLDSVRFRRQQVLGPYVVDFLCLEPKVVIEVDGGQHAEQVSNDLRRTEYLKVSGYRVIRFWNHEVLGDPDAVLQNIRAALVEIPSELVKKSTALTLRLLVPSLGVAPSGLALRFAPGETVLCSGETRLPFARDDFFTSSQRL